MFCPSCGKPEQKANTYCRQCGQYLPDFDKIKKREIPPEQHFTVNSTLNAMTAIVSLALVITLYSMFLGKEDTPLIIYLTAGFLTAIFFWQVQIFWRTMLLKKQLPGLKKKAEDGTQHIGSGRSFRSAKTNELLNQADFSDSVPSSIVENTTKELGEKVLRQPSQTKH